MARGDIEALRLWTPDALERVRQIITTVELGLQQAGADRYVGRSQFVFERLGNLTVSVGRWNALPARLNVPSVPHRTVTVSLPGQIMGGQSNPGLVYVTQGPRVAFTPDTPVVLPGELAPNEWPFLDCKSIELSGSASDDQQLLFAEGDLKTLSSEAIKKRLDAFRILAEYAITGAEV